MPETDNALLHLLFNLINPVFDAQFIKKRALLDEKPKMFYKYGCLKNVKYTSMTFCLNQAYR